MLKALHVFLHLERLSRQWAVLEDEVIRKRESNMDFNAAINELLNRMGFDNRMGLDHSLHTEKDVERRHILLPKPLFPWVPTQYTSHWVVMMSMLYWLRCVGIYQELHCERGSVRQWKEQELQSLVKLSDLGFACYYCASWETCMQVRKPQLELDMEQTGSK